ncbi:restriction endonuclease subunit S [Vreelandella glaciei]|uniref:restriction endonuclease subunit S n=1 Tax=Vreelandella glaciei TaxID=186761 RepID=UPI0030032498
MSARELITDHLDLWTRAVTKKSSSGRGSNGKVELTGIKKLRELTLELAVRGLLTEQRIDESNASEIVANLEKEQKQLVAAGLIKKPKPLKPIDENEKPYPLPKGWQWVRLGHTMEMYNGRAFKSSEWSTSGLPIVRIQNLNDPKAPTNYFSGPLDDRHSIDSGTFLISWSGTPGTSFGAFIWTRGPAALNQHINKCVFFGDFLNPEFMQLAVNGQMKNFIQSAQGGVGLKHVTKGVLANALIALPPREEQNHIVQKVDELMALCDRLEQQTSDQLGAHETLVDTLLGTLIQSANATELADNWARLAEHFDTLFTTEQSIDKLKQTILQLAVMGRLVEQDAGDEAASKLVARVKEYLKQQNIKPITRDRSTHDPSGFHYPLPSGWIWCEVNDIFAFANGKAHEKYVDDSGQYILINSRFVSNSGRIQKRVSERLTPLNEGDIAIVMSDVPKGRALARCYLVESSDEYTLNQRIGGLTTSPEVNRQYMLSVLNRHPYLLSYDDGKKQTNLKKIQILSTPLPVPPLAEQNRIVQKVDELMALCDHLKQRLTQAINTRCQLAGVVVEDALN